MDAKSQDLSSTVTHEGRNSSSGDDYNDGHAAKSASSLSLDMNAKMTVTDPESDSTNLHSSSLSSSSIRSAKSKSSSPSTAADAKSSSVTVIHDGMNSTGDSTITINSSSSSSNIVSQPVVSSSRRDAALPHHVPKIESLSNKMEELRKTMGNEVSEDCLLTSLLISDTVDIMILIICINI